MNKVNLHAVLKEQFDLLESQGLSVAYICIYGSQNYKLDIHAKDYQSDIDMKAIVVPTLDDLVCNSKPISIVVETKWGQCDIKDIRSYFEVLLKANPAYVETLYTDYYYINPKFTDQLNMILSSRDELMSALSGQFIKAMYGMMCEKQKALCHPYPSIKEKIDKYGYDGKQLSHAYRMIVMMEDFFFEGKPLKACFVPDADQRLTMLKMKLNDMELKDALESMSLIINTGKDYRDSYLHSIDFSKIDYSVKEKFMMLSQDIIKNNIVNEIKGDARCK